MLSFKVAMVLVSFYSSRAITKTPRWHPLQEPGTVQGLALVLMRVWERL